jgi:predicted dehydrogenase
VAARFEDLIAMDLDGVVIATPSAQHAQQAIAALDAGLAVFCQKPLGRDARETAAVLDAARRADRLLGVDLSYRGVEALRAARAAVASGELGTVHTLDLVFHNAYGPDKPWFTDRALAGGGCLIDLGTHLVDLALWLTGARAARVRTARVLHRGGAVPAEAVEDFATAELEVGGAVARVSCSWFLPAGRDCAFEATAWGTEGTVSVTNVGGSFYDFRAERFAGTRRELLAEPPDAWGGRAIGDWARQLAADRSYDPAADELQGLADAIDAIYAQAAQAAQGEPAR